MTVPDRPVVLDTRVVTGTGGGPEKTILNSPRFLELAGYHMLCGYMHPPDDPGFEDLKHRARILGAPLLSIPDRGPVDHRAVRQLLAICRGYRVAIWHAHDYKTNLLGVMLRRLWPMRLVTTVHGWVERTSRTPLYYAIDRVTLPRYERVICVSPDLRDRCISYGVRPDRCLLVENGIDTEQFSRRLSQADAKTRLGIPAERFVIGAVGRLSEEKGFDRLIRASHRLLQQGRNLQVLIVGEGKERSALESLIASLGYDDRIQLLGYIADPMPIYEAMDVYALSSLREGLPNVVLEAMALDVPVVATRIAGIPRLVSHGENGLIVEPDDEPALEAAIARLLDDAALRHTLAQSGRETVKDRYSFAVRMDRIRAIYDELLDRGPIGPATQTCRPEACLP